MKIEKEIVAGCGCAGIKATKTFREALDRRIKEIAAQERADGLAQSMTQSANCAVTKTSKQKSLVKSRRAFV